MQKRKALKMKKIVSALLILIFVFSIQVSIIYLAFNPPNKEIIEYDFYYTYEITRDGNHIYVLRTTHYVLKTLYSDYPLELQPQDENSVKLGVSVPIDPFQFESTGDQDYLIHPTNFNDLGGFWTNEIDAYDWDNGTNADLTTSADTSDVNFITFNTTDNQAEDITYVDLYLRVDMSGLANDYATISWWVGATQGTGTFVIDSGNQAQDMIISFENLAEPNDATWSWTDIANIEIHWDHEKLTGADTIVAGIDEIWGWIDVAAGAPPDTTDPDIDSPSDQEVELGSTGNSIVWTVGDANPNNYIIYRNDSNVENGAWTNGTIDADTGELDGLGLGIYNLTLWVDDDSSNSATDLVWFTVSDSTSPVLDSPSDIQYEYGTTSNTITWTATDLDADNWDVTKDLSPYDSGTWESGVGIPVDIDGLALGVGYSFVITVYDGTGNFDTDTVLVDVVDETNPNLNTPSDFSYEYGSTSNEVSWIATDLLPDDYRIYRNDTLIDEGTWISGTPITKNIDGLSLGIYNFTIFVNDTSSNSKTDILWVTVEDSISPILDSPIDIEYELGTTSNTITWTATDLLADNYIVEKNETGYDSGSWTSGVPIVIDIDGFVVGIFNLTIICYDTSNNWDSDEVIVTVVDSTNPLIDNPADDSYELGSTSNIITWTATDLDANDYYVWKNGSQIDYNTWVTATPIVVDIDGFTLGNWNITIACYDSSSNYVTDLVWILVSDSTNPQIDSPSDKSMELGSTTDDISWTATDLDADTFEVFKNSSTFDSGSWTTSVPIVIELDGIILGLWNMSIICYDGTGNFVIDLVWLTVEDTVSPLIDHPADDEYQYGSSGNTIVWTATDLDADVFEVFKNETTFDSGSWTTEIGISIDIDGFEIGIYNMTIIVWDGSTNYVIDLVWITVSLISDETDPDISSPSDQEVELGSTGNLITWTVGDENPNNYVIYRNDSNVESGSWTNGTLDADSTELDGLSLGIYNITLWIDDVSGNFAVDLVWFTVSDSTNPLIDNPADDSYELGSTSNLISWTATDLDADVWEVKLDTVYYDSGSWTTSVPIPVDIDGLNVGVDYSFVITVWDVSNNFISDTVLITVVDSTDPLIDNPSDNTYELGSSDNWVNWTATDLAANTYEVFKNSSSFDSGSWTTGIAINVSIDVLTLGLWNMSIICYDESSNYVIDLVWITIQDSVSPLIDSPSDKSMELGSITDDITWTATDLDANNYIVEKNETTFDSGSWSTSVPIIIELDGILLGLWNMSIICYDGTGNFVIDIVWLTVEDSTNPLIDHPADDSYLFETTGHTIVWTATDLDANNYIVEKNETSYDSGFWVTSVGIIIDIDGFIVGIFNMTIVCYDGTGNFVIDLVWIEVYEAGAEPPTINSPSDFSYAAGTLGHIIIWIAIDLDPDNYTVYCNTVSFENGTWESEVAINVNVDGLTSSFTGSRIWNITIIVQDLASNTAFDTVLVTVFTQEHTPRPPPIPPNPTPKLPFQVSVQVQIIIAILIVIAMLCVVFTYYERKGEKIKWKKWKK